MRKIYSILRGSHKNICKDQLAPLHIFMQRGKRLYLVELGITSKESVYILRKIFDDSFVPR